MIQVGLCSTRDLHCVSLCLIPQVMHPKMTLPDNFTVCSMSFRIAVPILTGNCVATSARQIIETVPLCSGLFFDAGSEFICSPAAMFCQGALSGGPRAAAADSSNTPLDCTPLASSKIIPGLLPKCRWPVGLLLLTEHEAPLPCSLSTIVTCCSCI